MGLGSGDLMAGYVEGLGSWKIPPRRSPAAGLRLSDQAITELVKAEAMDFIY